MDILQLETLLVNFLTKQCPDVSILEDFIHNTIRLSFADGCVRIIKIS